MSDELRETFFLECFELLEVLESGLLDLANGEAEDQSEVIAAVFRAVHSIKGGAGAFYPAGHLPAAGGPVSHCGGRSRGKNTAGHAQF